MSSNKAVNVSSFSERSEDGSRRVDVHIEYYDMDEDYYDDYQIRHIKMEWSMSGRQSFLVWDCTEMVDFPICPLEDVSWASDEYLDDILELGDEFLANGVDFANIDMIIKRLRWNKCRTEIDIRFSPGLGYHLFGETNYEVMRFKSGYGSVEHIRPYVEPVMLNSGWLSFKYSQIACLSVNEYILLLNETGRSFKKLRVHGANITRAEEYRTSTGVGYCRMNVSGVVLHISDEDRRLLASQFVTLARVGYFNTGDFLSPVSGDVKKLSVKAFTLGKSLLLRVVRSGAGFKLHYFDGDLMTDETKISKSVLVWGMEL